MCALTLLESLYFVACNSSNHFIIIITGKNILGEGVPKDERGDEIYFQCGFRVVPSHFGKVMLH